MDPASTRTRPGKLMRFRHSWQLVTVGALALTSLGCASEAVSSAERFAQVTLNFLTPATVRSVAVEVSGPGLAPPVVKNIAVGSDSTARATFELPAGAGRRFVFSAFDSTGVTTHRADTTIAVAAGTNPALAVRLQPLIGALGVTVTFVGAQVSVADTSTRRLLPRDTVRISASGVRASGTTVPADSLEWGSSDPSVATVVGGLVTAVRPGTTSVSVSYRGAAARVGIVVRAVDVPSLAMGGGSSVEVP